MKEINVTFKVEGGKIQGILHKPVKDTKCAIILAHGLTGNKNGPDDVYIRLADKLAENGFATLRFNFRFTNPDTWKDFEKMTVKGEVKDARAAIDYLRGAGYNKIGLVGESMGGAVVVLSYNSKINCIVLWYPAIFLADTPSFKQMLGREEEVNKKGYLTIVKEKFGTKKEIKLGEEFFYEGKNLAVIDYIKKIKSPLLLITGNADESVPHVQSEEAYRVANEPKKLEIINGADHCWRTSDSRPNINYQQKAIHLTVDWFKKWLK